MSAVTKTPGPGSFDPVALKQIRREISSNSELMRISNLRFSLRMLEQIALWSVGAVLIFLFESSLAILTGATFIGAVYARNLEFVHECIHNTAVSNRRLNVIFGTVLALPMLTSFQEWKFSHLRHHADVRNEGFQFEVDRINGLFSLMNHYLMLDHLRETFARLLWSLHPCPKPRNGVPIKAIWDYRLMALFLLAGTVASLILESLVFVYLWLLPLVPASIFNFHIQLPEHYECETASTDALKNSRTVKASKFLAWLVNNNNYHTAHHWAPAVPIPNLPKVDKMIAPYISYASNSYHEFFKNYYKNFKASSNSTLPRV